MSVYPKPRLEEGGWDLQGGCRVGEAGLMSSGYRGNREGTSEGGGARGEGLAVLPGNRWSAFLPWAADAAALMQNYLPAAGGLRHSMSRALVLSPIYSNYFNYLISS